MSHKNLEIWQLVRELVIDSHKMTLNKLPKFEMFEEGRQNRDLRPVSSIQKPESSIQHPVPNDRLHKN